MSLENEKQSIWCVFKTVNVFVGMKIQGVQQQNIRHLLFFKYHKVIVLFAKKTTEEKQKLSKFLFCENHLEFLIK